MKLTKKQTKALDFLEDKSTNELLFGGGAGGAKSFLGCLWIILNCLNYPGTRWVIGRSKLKSLKRTTLNTFFEVAQMLGMKAGKDYVYNAQLEAIKIGDSEILLQDLFHYPSDPNYDSLGSLEITGAFIDECNQIKVKAKEILKSRIRYKLTEYNLIPKILMTCNPAKNWTYTDFFKPDRDNTLESNKKFIQSLATDNPYISQHYIENLKTLDKNSKERLLFGNWEYDSDLDKLMDYNYITDIFSNSFIPQGLKYISCDIARKGKDKTVAMVWSGYRVIEIITIDIALVTETANKIKEVATKHQIPMSRVVADEDGVGGGVVDILGCIGFVNNSRPIKESNQNVNYANLKSQCYFKFAQLVNQSEVFVDCPADTKEIIIEELEIVRRKNSDQDGKLAVEGKKEMIALIGRSPDYADCLMMRLIFDLKETDFSFSSGIISGFRRM
tara:strand:+ start:1425 stop:2756 length:1332 start_codon:yes stop_codon:yes gene_type:complete